MVNSFGTQKSVQVVVGVVLKRARKTGGKFQRLLFKGMQAFSLNVTHKIRWRRCQLFLNTTARQNFTAGAVCRLSSSYRQIKRHHHYTKKRIADLCTHASTLASTYIHIHKYKTVDFLTFIRRPRTKQKQQQRKFHKIGVQNSICIIYRLLTDTVQRMTANAVKGTEPV